MPNTMTNNQLTALLYQAIGRATEVRGASAFAMNSRGQTTFSFARARV